MGEFIKPKTVYVTDEEYIKKLANLKKDLHDNEEVCEYCHGTGMVIADNVYGLTEDPDKRAGMFPYKHQSITFCPRCYNGIVHRCKLCGNIIKRGYTKCDCDKQKAVDDEIKKQEEAKAWENAPVAPKEIAETMGCFYSPAYGHNDGYFFDWDEFFEYWADEVEQTDEKPKYVWATEPVEMSIDATDIIEDATNDLYEDAIDDISDKARKELQEYLDNWCKTCGVGTTYYESHKYKVRIPWELYND